MTRKILFSLFATAAMFTLCFVTACEQSPPGGAGAGNNTQGNAPSQPIQAPAEDTVGTTDAPSGG